MGDNRPSVYLEDGTVIYRASAFGGCQRALVAARLGMPQSPPPPWLQRAFDDGNRGEVTVIEMMKEYGWEFEPGSGQGYVEFDVIPGVKLRGHSDGKARPWIVESGKKTQGDRVLVEIKTMSANIFEKTWKTKGIKGLYELYPQYPWQLSAYMIESGLPGLVVLGVKKKDGSGDVDRLVFHRVDEPPVSLGQIKARIVTTEALAKKGVPPDDCDRAANGWCPASFLCQPKEDEVFITEVDDTADAAIEVAALAYSAAKDAEAIAKAAKDAARDELVTLMGAAKKKVVGDFIVTLSTSTPVTLDTKALKAALPAEVWQPFEKTAANPTKTLKVASRD